MNCLKSTGYLGEDFKNFRIFSELCEKADVGLSRVYGIHQLLPPSRNTPYHLRPRAHNYELPVANSNLKKLFIHRML